MPTLAGTIERIVFRNQETYFTVARLAPQTGGRTLRGALITLVGALPGVNVGELIEVTGEWEAHPQHGRNLRVANFKTHAPVTPLGLKRYLGSGAIKGIGPKTAERIVDHFGEQTLAVLELEPERLTEVRGIGARARDLIIAGWAALREIRDIMVFLQGYEVSPGLATKIYQQYGQQSLPTIRENPYQLEHDIRGVGFKTADALALRLGLPRDGLPRAMTGIKHVLSEAASADGHCYLPRGELLDRATALLDMPRESLVAAVDALTAEKEVFVEPAAATPPRTHEEEDSATLPDPDATSAATTDERVYLAPFFYAESGTARRLRLLLDTPSPLPPVPAGDWSATFEALARDLGLALSPTQRTAVQMAYESKVMLLTGGPGVGKTTTLRALLDVLDRQGIDYALAAPTGRAAKRMTEATGRPASTLHRLLEFIPTRNEFLRNEDRPLPYRVVIVDEVSMLDILLAYRLVRAVAPQAHLLLVGDADQLPSVGPGRVLADLLASMAVPHAHLTELFRQARESAIIVTAHRVNEGQLPDRRADPNGDFFFVPAETPEATARAIADLVARRLPARYGLDPIRDIQVLAPMYKGSAGVTALNAALQARLNGRTQEGVTFGDHVLRVGDKVMQVRNNYDKGPAGVFNGDLGRIVGIEDERRVIVRFGEDEGAPVVTYEPYELDELTLAYACSIHRAQGSEYPCVVLPMVLQHGLLLQRNLIYTGITRARRLCVVVGQWSALARAVANIAQSARNTGLAGRLTPRQPHLAEARPRPKLRRRDVAEIAEIAEAPMSGPQMISSLEAEPGATPAQEDGLTSPPRLAPATPSGPRWDDLPAALQDETHDQRDVQRDERPLLSTRERRSRRPLPRREIAE